jgi:hypothetical protein
MNITNRSRTLKEALSKREKTVSLLANLTKMKTDGSVTEDQYQSMKTGYGQTIDSLSQEIDGIKSGIGADLQAKEKELESYRQELSNLTVRQKVGEISANEFQKLENRLKGKIGKAEGEISALKTLASVQSSSDIAGAVPEVTKTQSITTGSKGSMTISDLLSRAFEIYKENPIIVVPSLLPVAWSIISTVFLAALIFGTATRPYYSPYSYDSGGAMMSWVAGMMGGMAVFLIGFLALLVIAEGMTIEMIREAFEGGRADLSSAWESTKGKLAALIVAAIVVSVILFFGYVLLVIPGLILTLLLYFVAQAIMIDNKGALESLGASYNFVKANLTDSAIVALLSIAIYFVLSMIPLLGILLVLVAMPYLIAISTLLYLDRR